MLQTPNNSSLISALLQEDQGGVEIASDLVDGLGVLVVVSGRARETLVQQVPLVQQARTVQWT